MNNYANINLVENQLICVVMNDPEIRQLLFSRFARRKSFLQSQLVEEVPIQNGLVRADVVMCGKRLECFEIKSHNDTLKRLVVQGWQYEQSFDYVTLVCATKHLSKAMGIVPHWWGIIEVTGSGKLINLRNTSKNANVNIHGIVDLLENEEAKRFLRHIGITKGISRMSHYDLRDAIFAHSNIGEIRDWVIDVLQARETTWKPSLQANHLPYPSIIESALAL